MSEKLVNNGVKIEIKDLGKKYEGRTSYTLENINLTFEKNDFIAILGPSGCGKTTLLRMIAGLNSITKGDLLFDDKRVNELDSSERGIAMVFQSYALYPHMTVYENLAFGLKLRKEKKDVIDKKIKEVAYLLDIYEYLYNKPRELSGGQQQRVAIGRAIARNPKVFLMDEPLSNLDAKLREKMRKELVKIHRLVNSTSIYVTHDQLEAMSMATKIVLLNNSKVQQIGTPEELYSKPANLFVATFIGSPTMNTFEGTVKNKVFNSKKGNIKFKLDFADGKYIVGFRSEDITFAEKNKDAEAKVIQMELLGKDRLVILDGGIEEDFIISASINDKIDENKNYGIKFNVKNIHIFDQKTSERIN